MVPESPQKNGVKMTGFFAEIYGTWQIFTDYVPLGSTCHLYNSVRSKIFRDIIFSTDV